MRFLLFGFILLFSNLGIAQEWKLKKEVDGIQAFHKPTTTSKFNRYRITTEIEGSLESMVAILQDIDNYPKIFHDLRKATLVNSDYDNKLEIFLHTKTPFPVKDRFSYSDTTFEFDKTTKTVSINITCVQNEYLEEYKSKGVVIKDCNGLWKIQDVGDGKLYVEHEFFADPAGQVPAWIVNKRTIDSPIKTIQSIRKIIKKEKYQNSTFSFMD